MIYRFGNYELDAPHCALRCAGQQVAIEPKVFAVLVYLLQHRDRMVTKEELLEHCWPETFVSKAALTRCLAKVRKTVQSESAGAPVIKTLYGRGYCFVAPVTVLPHALSLPLRPAAHEGTSVTTGRSKILIVDDEPFNVDYLEQELEDLGYETISAANGQEALDAVAIAFKASRPGPTISSPSPCTRRSCLPVSPRHYDSNIRLTAASANYARSKTTSRRLCASLLRLKPPRPSALGHSVSRAACSSRTFYMIFTFEYDVIPYDY